MRVSKTLACAWLALVFPAVPASAQPVDPAPAPAPDADSTAVRLQRLDTRLTVDVMIDGAGPFRFMVDSGANRTVVSRQVAALLGLPAAGSATLHSLGGAGPVETVRIERLELGGLPAAPMTAPVLEQDDIGASGILGIDALAGKQVMMDLRRNRMEIRRTGTHAQAPSFNADEIVVTARRRFGELILVDADLDGMQLAVILDTGTDTTIGNMALERRLDRRHGFLKAGIALHDVAGRTTQADVALLPTLRIGTMKVLGAPAAFADAHPFRQFGVLDRPAMLLGMDLLRTFRRIIIDFGSRKVRFLLD